jgi:hypothetical protein
LVITVLYAVRHFYSEILIKFSSKNIILKYNNSMIVQLVQRRATIWTARVRFPKEH